MMVKDVNEFDRKKAKMLIEECREISKTIYGLRKYLK
jgi:hypothetical protein